MAIFITPGGQFTGGTLSSGLTLASGTASGSPLTFQSGTVLTTPASGAVEYDGKVVYTTPAGRGVSPSMMFYRLNSNYAGSNTTGAQSVLGVGLTLAANTVYQFNADYLLSKTAGTTAHTIGLNFGGTATINNILYKAYEIRSTVSVPGVGTGTFAGAHITVPTNATITTSSIVAATFSTSYTLMGTVSINAGGTFIPQYQLSAAPGGAYSTIAGSYFAIWPIGTAGSNTSVGPWA